MKLLVYTILTIIGTQVSQAQIDSVYQEKVRMPHAEFVEQLYNSELDTLTTSYNYSNQYDVDGDGVNDSLYFIGNGGAHAYYHLRIILTNNGKTYDYPTVQLDNPYPTRSVLLCSLKKRKIIQFFLADITEDGTSELYLNFRNDMSTIPEEWQQQGVKSKYILLDYKDGELIVKDYLF